MSSPLVQEAHVPAETTHCADAATTSPSANLASSAPAKARRARLPLLSVALPPIDMDAVSPIAATPRAEAHAPLPFSAASPTPLYVSADSSSGAQAHRTSPREKKRGADAPHVAPLSTSSAMTSAPRVPVLQLLVHATEDGANPVNTLHTRLFREAEERLQRQPRAPERRVAAQQLQKERHAHHPHALLSRGESTACQHFVNPSAHAPSANESAQVSSGAAQMSDADSSARISARKGDTGVNRKRTEVCHTLEAAACERLYRNAIEQAERRGRRMQALREVQEAEFQATCTFRPSISPAKEGFLRHSTTQGVRSLSAGARGVASARGATAVAGGGSSASPHRARSLSAVQRTPPRLWRHFSAAQEEMRIADKRLLGGRCRRTEAESRPSLYADTPPLETHEHLRTNEEKAKGHRGPIDGWSGDLAHHMKGKHSPVTAVGKLPSASARDCQPGSGAPPTRTSLPDDTSLGDRLPQSESDPGGGPSGIFTTPQRQTPVCSGAHAQSKTNQDGAAAFTLPQVFSRLFRDSDERRAVQAFIQLMREHRQHTELHNANQTRNSAFASARSPRSGRRPPGAPFNKDTAVAVDLTSSGATDSGMTRQRADPDRPFIVGHTAFDALCTEQGELQRRPECRQWQAESDKENYALHPFMDVRSRVLAEARAWRHSEGTSAAAETARERRVQTVADAEAKQAACRAQVRFSYPAFPNPLAERHRQRKEEFKTVLMSERSGDVRECRFRPALSKLTEAASEEKSSYNPIIDHPMLAQRRMGAGMCPAGHSSVPAAAAAICLFSPLRKRSPYAGGTLASPTVLTRNPRPLTVETVEQFDIGAAEEHAALKSASPPSQQWHDVAHTNSVLEPAEGAMGSPEQRHHSHLGLPHDSASAHSWRHLSRRADATAGATVVDTPRFQGAIQENIDTVQIAGAASSAYLRQLESELQDALKDRSHCLQVPMNVAK